MPAPRSALLIAALCVTQAGCYHQVFNTGLAPAATGVTKAWHPTWIFGLVAATPIDVRATCPNGVAIASTRMTFANGLVGGLTLGIYTPHEVKIVCAASAAAGNAVDTRHLAATASAEGAARVFADAVQLSAERHGPVAIVIDTVPSTAAAEETTR